MSCVIKYEGEEKEEEKGEEKEEEKGEEKEGKGGERKSFSIDKPLCAHKLNVIRL
jgi:hypothetical protein